MKRWMIPLAVILALLFCHGARAAREGPYLYGVLQSGGTASVRLQNPADCLLVLGAYDRATHEMRGAQCQTLVADSQRHTVSVTLDPVPASTEYLLAFLLTPDTLQPLCTAVLADYVIPAA